MSLAILLLGIFVVVGLNWVLAWRHGVSPSWPPGDGRGPYPVALEDEDETAAFNTDFGPKRERPPTEADGPGRDS